MSDTLDEKRPTRGDARRDAIVQAARKVCLEKGFSKITVSDIASEVGMTRFAVLPLLRRQGSRS